MSAHRSQRLSQAPWIPLLQCIAAGFAVGVAATIVLALIVVLFDAATQAHAAVPDRPAAAVRQRDAGGAAQIKVPGLDAGQPPAALPQSNATAKAPPDGRDNGNVFEPLPHAAKPHGLDLALGWLLLVSGIAALLLLGGRRR